MKILITWSIFILCSTLNLTARNGGIQNCGASCYFNSGIQTLSQIESLNKILDQKKFTPDSIPDLYMKLKNTLKDCPTNMPWYFDEKTQQPYQMTYIPSNHNITALETLNNFWNKSAAQFFPRESTTTEQDSSEFVAMLIHEFNLNKTEIDNLFSPKITRILNCNCKNPIQEIISLQDFRCGEGRDEVAKKMTTLFIRVYLATHNATTLNACLDHTFRKKKSKKKRVHLANKNIISKNLLVQHLKI